ncbi:hypothetical protein H2204_007629 [Knufia peltigerae]|uniref:Major facilitator superfamily (MFS) profile domain-containing protein n=1 Tax=Knufia peltigerae TaxID=1002370 RepID=A0AA38Y1I2_9EURO|nr:hypothetical protein H2204_007629 [Knufia peltigerae]
MEADKAIDVISGVEGREESKTDSQAKANTFEYIEEEPEPHLHLKTYLIVVAVSFVSFAQLIQLVAAGALSATVAEAVGGADKSSWMLSSLTITFVVFAPPVSQAADYWGRRWLLIILALTGCVGTIITSRAKSIGVAILGEVFVGACYAATPLQFAVASEVLPRRQRLVGQAAINAAGGVGSIFALLSGGKLVDVYGPQGYRYIYYINAGIFAVAAAVVFLLYRPPVLELQKSLTTREKLSRLDWPGYGITMCAVVLFSMGLSWANNPYSWRNPHVLAPFLVGIAMFILLAVYCWKLRKNSFIPHALFSRDRNLALSLLAIFCEGLIFAAANIYVPTQTAILYTTTTLGVSLVFTVCLVCYVLGSPITAIISYKFKNLRVLIMAGFVLFVVWAICMATSSLGSAGANWGYQAILGCALALVLNPVVASSQLSAPPELMFTKLMPSKVAEAALQNGLPEASLPSLILALLGGDPSKLTTIPGINKEIIGAAAHALKGAYLDSFHSVWVATACLSACGLIASWFIINPSKDLNNHIDNPAESEDALYGDK